LFTPVLLLPALHAGVHCRVLTSFGRVGRFASPLFMITSNRQPVVVTKP
jgi:hypothetical protein